MTYDRIPSPLSWSGASALVWVCLLGALVIFGVGNCSPQSDTLLSYQGAAGALAVALTSKIVFGPSTSTFKSMMLKRDGTLIRPVSYILFDYATVYPVNFLSAVVTKSIWFGVFWVVLWLLAKIGVEERSTTTILPNYVVLTMVFSYLARMSKLFINLNSRGEMFPWVRWGDLAKIILVLVLIVSWVPTYALLERALTNCGAHTAVLPTYHQLIGGIAVLPIIEAAIALIF
jgi:hypothetical protein